MITSRAFSLFSIIVCAATSAFLLGAARSQSARPQTNATQVIAHGQPSVTVDGELLHENAPVETEVAGIHEHKKVVWMTVTAYCSCPKCCGPKARGLTASGR